MTNTPAVPNQIRSALQRVRSFQKVPWLERPVYYRFIQAMSPQPSDALDPYQRGLWQYAYLNVELTGDMEPVALALSYWNSELIRTHLCALFFGGAAVNDVAKSMSLEELSVDAFRCLFCETDVFGKSPLLLMEYVHQLPEIEDRDKQEKTLYRMAVDFGWEWVVWKITRGAKGHQPGIHVVDTMTNLAFWRALEGSASPMNSEAAREGRQYMKMAAELAMNKHRTRMGDLNSIEDLALRLQSQSPEDYEKEHYTDAPPEISALLYEDETKEK